MILVDIFVPSLDKTYDFRLNENVMVETVIEEISEMIEQKERTIVVGDIGDLLLCAWKTKLVLDRKKTLFECGVTTGECLVLV